jgi:hypothetical protein
MHKLHMCVHMYIVVHHWHDYTNGDVGTKLYIEIELFYSNYFKYIHLPYQVSTRVSFKPKIPIWVNFGAP